MSMDTAMSTVDETLRARLMLLLSEAMDKLSLTSCNDNEFEQFGSSP